MSTDLAGKLAVVTGASGNLGPVWCQALEGAGMRVVRIDVQPADGVEVADVTDGDALRAIRERIGAPDVLVNNAGIDQPPDPAKGGGIEGVDADEFLRVLDVNTRGVFVVTQVFGSAMAEAGRGSIVNIGSLYSVIAPEPRFYDHMDMDPPFLKPAAYGASKAGVINLTRYFARLWGPTGVRVNALTPGGVHGGQDPEFLSKFTARVPFARMAEAADLGGPLVFLASEASSYLTGHHLLVDGGFTA